MKYITIINLIFLLVSCSKPSVNNYDEQLAEFSKFYGKEKTESLIHGLESFDRFLELNYSNVLTLNEKTILFIKQYISKTDSVTSEWIIDLYEYQTLKSEFESTKLRKDLWLFGYEMNELYEEIIPITRDSLYSIKYKEDSKRYLNKRLQCQTSEMITALKNMNPKDTVVLSYIDAREICGNISLDLLINGLLMVEEKYDYTNIMMRIILFNELYYNIIYKERTGSKSLRET